MTEAESSVLIKRPVTDVFDFVTDTRNEPQWHTDVLQAEPISDGPTDTGTRFRWLMNFMGTTEVVMRVARFERNHIEELEAENAVMGLKPTITFLFEAAPQGTKFTRKISMTSGSGSRVVDPLRLEQIEKSNGRFVENLKRLLESR